MTHRHSSQLPAHSFHANQTSHGFSDQTCRGHFCGLNTTPNFTATAQRSDSIADKVCQVRAERLRQVVVVASAGRGGSGRRRARRGGVGRGRVVQGEVGRRGARRAAWGEAGRQWARRGRAATHGVCVCLDPTQRQTDCNADGTTPPRISVLIAHWSSTLRVRRQQETNTQIPFQGHS